MGRNLRLWAALATAGVVLLSLFATLAEQPAEAASLMPVVRQANSSPIAKRLNADEYLALLSSLDSPDRDPTRTQTDYSSVEAGPAKLALSRFFPGRDSNEAQIWIEASFADITNLALVPRAFAQIEIERVQRADGVNIYAKDSRFETKQFETLSLESGGAHGAASGVRSVRIARNAKRDDVAYVSGRVALNLPIGVQTFALSHSDIGTATVADSGASAALTAMDAAEVVFLTTGRPEAYVTVYGYDSSGNRLAAAGEAVSVVGTAVERTARFHGPLDHIEVIFAEGYLTKKYPFVLKGPGARRHQSIGPQPKIPAGPLIVDVRERPPTQAA